MGTYSRGGHLFEGRAYSIISPLGWALIPGEHLFEGVLVQGIMVSHVWLDTLFSSYTSIPY